MSNGQFHTEPMHPRMGAWKLDDNENLADQRNRQLRQLLEDVAGARFSYDKKPNAREYTRGRPHKDTFHYEGEEKVFDYKYMADLTVPDSASPQAQLEADTQLWSLWNSEIWPLVKTKVWNQILDAVSPQDYQAMGREAFQNLVLETAAKMLDVCEATIRDKKAETETPQLDLYRHQDLIEQ